MALLVAVRAAPAPAAAPGAVRSRRAGGRPGAHAGDLQHRARARPDRRTRTRPTGRTSDYPAVVPDLLTRPILGRGYGTLDSERVDTYRIFDNEYLGAALPGRRPRPARLPGLDRDAAVRGPLGAALRRSRARAAGAGRRRRLPRLRRRLPRSTTSSPSRRRRTCSSSWRRCAPARPRSKCRRGGRRGCRR